MKIVDNKKDFYDYVVEEYGIDDSIVFDRRKSVVIKTDVKPEKYMDYVFSTIKGDKDTYPREEITYSSGKRKRGTKYGFTLKTGRHCYYFVVERYLIDDTNVCIETRLVKETDDDLLCPDLVLAILPGHRTTLFKFFTGDVCRDEIIDLPILTDTVIPGYVSAKDVFLNIYSYLSSEKEIEDNSKNI